MLATLYCRGVAVEWMHGAEVMRLEGEASILLGELGPRQKKQWVLVITDNGQQIKRVSGTKL